MGFEIPEVASAVQLTGPDALTLNRTKPVPQVGPDQILGKVEAVGLCFSDLKLLKQFDQHARKAEILSGISPEVLAEYQLSAGRSRRCRGMNGGRVARATM